MCVCCWSKLLNRFFWWAEAAEKKHTCKLYKWCGKSTTTREQQEKWKNDNNPDRFIRNVPLKLLQIVHTWLNYVFIYLLIYFHIFSNSRNQKKKKLTKIIRITDYPSMKYLLNTLMFFAQRIWRLYPCISQISQESTKHEIMQMLVGIGMMKKGRLLSRFFFSNGKTAPHIS